MINLLLFVRFYIMNLTNPPKRVKKNRFSSRSMRLVFHLLPSRMKRLIFISSVAGKLSGKKLPEFVQEFRQTRCNDTVVKLQEKFNLCQDPTAICLPLALNDKIWGSRPIDQLVCPENLGNLQSEHDITRTAREIVAKMPCFLVYDGAINIAKEVRELITARGELFEKVA